MPFGELYFLFMRAIFNWFKKNSYERRGLKHGILTLTALKYLSLNHGDQRVFQFEIIIHDFDV